jgi:hypothetical protein
MRRLNKNTFVVVIVKLSKRRVVGYFEKKISVRIGWHGKLAA